MKHLWFLKLIWMTTEGGICTGVLVNNRNDQVFASMRTRKRSVRIVAESPTIEAKHMLQSNSFSADNHRENYLRASEQSFQQSFVPELSSKKDDDGEVQSFLARYLLDETSVGLSFVTPTDPSTAILVSLPTSLPSLPPVPAGLESDPLPTRGSGQVSTQGPASGSTFPSIPTQPPTESSLSPPIILTPTLQPTAERIVLYSNDFESPNEPITPLHDLCPINTAGVNRFYGTQQNMFNQRFSVEIFIVNSMWNSSVPFADPQKRAGKYAISMLSTIQHDLLGLGFETWGKAFINIAMDVSSIDSVITCDPPRRIAEPIFRVSLLDDPLGTVPLTGTPLDFADMTGPAGPNPWTFQWTRNSISLNATGATAGRVSIVFDLLQSAYGALDNLVVEASDEAGTAQ